MKMKITKGKIAWIVFLVAFIFFLFCTLAFVFMTTVAANIQQNGLTYIVLFIVLAACAAVIFYVTTSVKMLKRIARPGK